MIDDAVLLYSSDMLRYVAAPFRGKAFVANNTLCPLHRTADLDTLAVATKYRITTAKNIICMGRMQRRKRIGDLIAAFEAIDMPDAGLILVGPDSDGLLAANENPKVVCTGPVYGEESALLLALADVYCLPGAVGLSIVDAFQAGLPLVTEDVMHGPEIMYLKEGVNGFVVPRGDIGALATKLRLLLSDDALRERFSRAAKGEIETVGHIDRFCEGFLAALGHACDLGERESCR